MTNKDSDEFYTPKLLVQQLYKEFTPDKVVLPFDSSESYFVKECNVPYIRSEDDFFAIPDSELIRWARDRWVVFSNPPFSAEKKIIDRLRRFGVRYYLIAHGLYWSSLVEDGDSVYYCGYIRYDTPTNLRPTQRTVVVTNDGKGIYRKCSFVPLYTKPYRGKKGLVFENNPRDIDLWDTHLYAIRGYEINLNLYSVVGTRLVYDKRIAELKAQQEEV